MEDDAGSGAEWEMMRMLRLLKFVRLVSLFRLFKQLHILVVGFLNALRPVDWTFFLPVLIVFTSADFVTSQIGQNRKYETDQVDLEDSYSNHRRHFGTMVRNMRSLFQILTLDSWAFVVRPLVEGPQAPLLFFFAGFIVVTTFGVLNPLIAALLENMVNIAGPDEGAERLLLDRQFGFFEHLFSKVDANSDGTLTTEEMKTFLESGKAESAFDDLGFEPLLNLKELKELTGIVSLLCGPDDETSPKHGLSIVAFLAAAARLRGQVRSADLIAAYFLAKGTRWIGRSK